VGHSERVRPASGKEAKKLGVFCGIKRGAAGGSTQRPAPLTTIEVEARPWLTTTIELPRLGCARIAALLRSRTRTARWCGAVPTGAQNSRRAPIWLPAPRFIRTSCAVPMRAASRPTRCPIAGKRGATGSPDRVEAARCRFGASASSDVTINRGDEASEGDIALSAENSAFGGRTDFVSPTPVRHPKSILWPELSRSREAS